MTDPKLEPGDDQLPEPEIATEDSPESYQDLIQKMEELGYMDCGLDI